MTGPVAEGAHVDRAAVMWLPAAVRQVSRGGSGAANGQTVAILADGPGGDMGSNRKGQFGDGELGRPGPGPRPGGM